MDNSKIQFRILEETFNPYKEFELWEKVNKNSANSLFLGRVRPFDQYGNDLKKLEIVHNKGMTEKYIKRYLMNISKKQDNLSIFLLHRIGFIYPNEPIILLAISANHRGIANKYLQVILEFTKYSVPFWKKEWTFIGSSWVKKNTDLGIEL